MTRLRLMTEADIPAGLALSRQAGWNQTEADWRRQLALQPDGCFAAEEGGGVAGTCCTCVFGPVAWIALVLVDAARRRRGIGRALLEHALAWLDERGAAAVRLDATPLGAPLYESLGFAPQFRLGRYAGVPAGVAAGPPVAAAPRESWPDLAALDAAVTRTDRQRLLLRLFEENPGEVRAVPDGQRWLGLAAARPGANATQLGPIVGAAGEALLRDALRRHAGRSVYVDIPEGNQAAEEVARQAGLTLQRVLTRMGRGPAVAEDLPRLWASSGPEKG